MSAEKNWQFELEEYIKQGEPGQIEKSEAWQTAIGLQAVDGLKTSAYLLDTAKEHIEGKISIDEVQKAGWDVGVAWQDGRMFLHPCSIRMNLALPLSRVKEAFERLDKYVFNRIK